MARISRRDMLRSGAMASAFAVSGGPLLARGQRGGRLRAGLSGASRDDSWDLRGDPGLFMLAAGQGAVFDCLTEVAADGALRGELAHTWGSADGGLSWEFGLRRDAVFHDGRPFTAADVVATFEAHGGRPEFLTQIERIKQTGPQAVRFELTAPNPSLPFQLSHPQLAIQPAGAYGSGIGTGLYNVAHFAPGARFLGRRVENHWKGDAAGFAEEIEIVALNTAAEQRAALKAGVVDVVSDLMNAEGLRGVRAQHDLVVTSVVRMPERIGSALPMDNARFAERWWLA